MVSKWTDYFASMPILDRNNNDTTVSFLKVNKQLIFQSQLLDVNSAVFSEVNEKLSVLIICNDIGNSTSKSIKKYNLTDWKFLCENVLSFCYCKNKILFVLFIKFKSVYYSSGSKLFKCPTNKVIVKGEKANLCCKVDNLALATLENNKLFLLEIDNNDYVKRMKFLRDL